MANPGALGIKIACRRIDHLCAIENGTCKFGLSEDQAGFIQVAPNFNISAIPMNELLPITKVQQGCSQLPCLYIRKRPVRDQCSLFATRSTWLAASGN